ncbi:hypothetical protein HMPREF2736_10085 [Corynebacterium sp. HMSC036E10]|nr:hypothetical protein HMPREF2736_10085 [Corynebacterium sp. HMSC036E10]
MLLPTSDYREALFPPAKLFRQFDLIWKLLTDAERDEIRQNRYYLDDDIPEVLERFTALGRENTNYPFVLPAESDSIIAEYLTWYRRMIDKYSAMRDKALRNLHIVTEATAGRSYRSIADETALTPSTVGDINRKGRNQEQYKAWQSLADEIPGDEPSLTNYVLQEHF